MKTVQYVALIAIIVGLSINQVAAQNLRLAHFALATSWQNEVMFEGWSRQVEQSADQSLSIRVFPAQTLGSAVEGYDNARRGIADIIWTVQGYTANRFPLSQIVELPGLFDTAEVGSCAFQKLYDSGALDEEYADTHVLYVHVHGPGHLHTGRTPVTQLDDMKGLQIRQPTAVIGQLLRELGAEPVGMPAPALYESMQRGVIDGFLLPWEAVVSFRMTELANHHTELGLYSLAFVKTMNRNSYARLSPEQRAAIDAHSGMSGALMAGRGYDQSDLTGRTQALESGTLHQLSPEQRVAWEAAANRAAERYLNELEQRGLPAREVYQAMVDFVSQCEQQIAAGEL